ncbi:hypothetical protein H4S01_006313 [Coemansia sp. RSA 2610]|nr:hypothetical protein H4S01_006313 [Coemansia sp. RSA 2610]
MSQPLFGGALSITVPDGFVDISQVRQLPDHQEVFASSTTDQSLIVEILEAVDEDNPLEYHFAQLAETNDSRESKVWRVARLSATTSVLCGEQLVAKFNERGANRVAVLLALVRVPEHSADVLVSLNAPLSISAESSSSAALSPDTDVEQLQAQFVATVQTLKINDYTLFG